MTSEGTGRSTNRWFRRALTLLVLTIVAPGSAQYLVGNRWVGRLALRVLLGLLGIAAIAAIVAVVSPRTLLSLVADDTVLRVLRVALLVLAGGWLLLFLDAWRLGRPLGLRRGQRLTVSTLTGLLAVVTTCALVVSSHYVATAHDALNAVFTGNEQSDPFAGRYNVLLLGTDGDEDRLGLRPDSVNVASIDEETGETALFSLPRNLEKVPFAEDSVMAKRFPNGFDCESECLLNGVYTWAMEHEEMFPEGVGDPGMEAMTSAVEGITGLGVNYHVIVDMQGFESLVDALGGLTIDVGQRLPIGGIGSEVRGHIEPGRQVLDGHDALWFVRSRAGSSDYERMARQRCAMAAMLNQLDPGVVMTKFVDLAEAGEQLVSTDIPTADLDTFVDLAWKAKRVPITTVQFVPPLIDASDPDYELIRAKVRDAIEGSSPPTTSDRGTGAERAGLASADGADEGQGGADEGQGGADEGQGGADEGSPAGADSEDSAEGEDSADGKDSAEELEPEAELGAVCSAG